MDSPEHHRHESRLLRSSRTTVLSLLVAVSLLGAYGPGAEASDTQAERGPVSAAVSSLDGEWMLAVDPKNAGLGEKWWTAPRPEAKTTQVPWIIQDAFPAYHGLAWYWRDFTVPPNPHAGGRYLLRFWAVDYKADVWVNDVAVGGHEGGETPFVLDVTDAIKSHASNRVAVRVLNPTREPIDGIVLVETAHRNKALPYAPGNAWDQGGIIDSVELLVSPAVRVEDLFIRPDWKTGAIRVQMNVRNAGPEKTIGSLELSVAPAASGETMAVTRLRRELPKGDTLIETQLMVTNPHLWDLSDPYLYRVTARVWAAGSESVDECSTRCGFRAFRFQDGYFRLNGKRIYLRCSHTGNCCPIGLELPHDPDYLRRDLINAKMMRFNAIRFIAGIAKRYQLDLADEIGLMVYEECYAGWCLADSPKMAERYDESVFGMIRRDRNHPSVAMWGLLNETSDGPVFRHAAGLLPSIRALDDSRIVMVNSGRWDKPGGAIGIQALRNAQRSDPCVTYNPTKSAIKAFGITWAPGQLAFHPGCGGEYAVVRWTAPERGTIDFAAVFTSIGGDATTDVHVMHNGKPLFDDWVNVNGRGLETKYSKTVEVKAGDTIDCVCGWGNKSCGGDTTALAVTIKSGTGKTFDAAAEFSLKQNPNGPWSYGQLAAGPSPDPATFALFRTAQAVGESGAGTLSKPGSVVWEDVLGDYHEYPRVPHSADIIHKLRTLGGNGQPMFFSEYGIGSAVDLLRVCRLYEQAGRADVEDARLYRTFRDRYLADWERWRMAEAFDRPEDFFAQSNARMASQRLLGLNAVRSNPNLIGHSMTGTLDQGMTAEGLWTTFRELKPGTTDAVFDGWAPLRWCLFVEPVNVYAKTPVRLEAVLANEDVLAPGEYPVRLQVVGPDGTRVFERTITVRIPDPPSKPEPRFALPVFAEDVVIDGPPGKYRFTATFERGAAAAGGDVVFYVDVADAQAMPRVETEVVLCTQDAELAKWLGDRGIRTRPFTRGDAAARQVILVSGKPAAGTQADLFQELARRMCQGSTAVFLTPDVFANGDKTAGWIPLKNKGNMVNVPRWLYHADDWAKRHPIFEGLPSGGLMDYTVYRELIPDVVWACQDPPTEAVAGAINAAMGYDSGLLMAVCDLGAGRFIVNTLRIRENLGKNPAAERLLRNMLRYAATGADKPPASLPDDFPTMLKSIGYRK